MIALDKPDREMAVFDPARDDYDEHCEEMRRAIAEYEEQKRAMRDSAARVVVACIIGAAFVVAVAAAWAVLVR